MCVQDNFTQKLIQPTWLVAVFLLQMRPLFFSVSAMAKHENRQKFVTRVAKNVQVVVVMVIKEIQKEALKINY